MFSISPLKKILIISLFALLFCVTAKAQQATESYSFELPKTKVSNSLYNKINFVDARTDTSNLGIIQTGAFNKQVRLITKEPLAIQFKNILNALIDSTAKPQELILQLRQLRFSEITGAVTEKGYFALRADLYAKTTSTYQKLSSIDTTVVVSAMDVTNKNLKRGSETIANFIAVNLDKKPLETTIYSYNDIVKVDSIEKTQLKLFNSTTYREGVYLTYYAFRDQLPNGQITVEGDELKKNNVKALLADGQTIKVKPTNTYAVVYKGQPYILTSTGYYILQKVNNNMVFTGRVDGTSPNASLAGAGASYGAIGGALTGLLIVATAEKPGVFEMKLDHITGQFIKMKQVINNPDPATGNSN